jgi:tetratricopeptide (TPR) repeat protein
MKRTLPMPSAETITLFPKNIRFITEYSFPDSQSKHIKVALVSIISIFLLTLIFLQAITFRDNLMQQQFFSQQRIQLQNEVSYWEQIANKYQGYRDVYYRIGSLEYKMGNVKESQEYVKKALELDPNFPEGRVLGTKIGI